MAHIITYYNGNGTTSDIGVLICNVVRYLVSEYIMTNDKYLQPEKYEGDRVSWQHFKRIDTVVS